MKYIVYAAMLLYALTHDAHATERAALIQRAVDLCEVATAQGWCSVVRDTITPDMYGQQWCMGRLGCINLGEVAAMQAMGDRHCAYMRETCTSNWEGAHCRFFRSRFPLR